MAGSNHGNTSSSSSHGGTGNHNHSTNTTTATGGRERAIEALIDREPYGDYYRAIRILVRLFSVCVCVCVILYFI